VDDSFAYRTTVPIRRQVDPRLIKAAFGSVVVLVAIALFGTWVVASERRSFERAHPAAPTAGASAVASPAVDEPAVAAPEPGVTDGDVEEALRLATDAARAIFTTDGSFVGATPARLGELQRGYTYVDGPSTTASVVSVASTRGAWAAAVLGPDGLCVWTTISADGAAGRATGAECTGTAALASMATP
jgi:hypothetical protein